MSRHALRARDFLQHMIEATSRIQEYVAGKKMPDFLSDRLLQDAVIRNIEVLGEASHNLLKVLPDAHLRYPMIPFSAIYATRNLLSHGYFLVEPSRVWEVVDRDVPSLRIELESAIRAWDAAPPLQ